MICVASSNILLIGSETLLNLCPPNIKFSHKMITSELYHIIEKLFEKEISAASYLEEFDICHNQ